MGERVFPKPRVFVSKCLGFDACRWNGINLPQDLIEHLQPHVEFVTTCPEVEIGLGVPRKPIRIVEAKGDRRRLIQSQAGLDLTERMEVFCDQYLRSLTDVDGFILKGRSPSCGVKSVKVYPGPMRVAALKRDGNGFFGSRVVELFPDVALEDEGRLRNLRIRERFLTAIFTMARFRQIVKSKGTGELVRFQATNKFLLMAYNQKEARELGRIVANHENLPFKEVARLYEVHLRKALLRTPRVSSIVNVLMHGLGYFSEQLSSSEKAFFLKTLEDYRADKVPLSGALGILQSWIVRFNNRYLMDQTFFGPFPEALIDQSGTCKR